MSMNKQEFKFDTDDLFETLILALADIAEGKVPNPREHAMQTIKEVRVTIDRLKQELVEQGYEAHE